MKSLFQSIRTGVITKLALESQLGKFKHDKIQLTREYLARKLGQELYTKKLAELNFCIAVLESAVHQYDDLKLPLKTKQTVEANPDETPGYDSVSGRALDDDGLDLSTEN